MLERKQNIIKAGQSADREQSSVQVGGIIIN